MIEMSFLFLFFSSFLEWNYQELVIVLKLSKYYEWSIDSETSF